FFNFELPRMGTADQLHKFALLVNALKTQYREKTGSDRFYVAFFPGRSGLAPQLILELEKLGIYYLDYSDLDLHRVTDEQLEYQFDGHPMKNSYKILAGLIEHDLLRSGRP